MPNEFLSKFLLDELAANVHNYVKSTINKEITKFTIKSCWAVCQYENDYNPVHWHSGHVSGVAYLKVPESFGDSLKKENRNGRIAFMHGSRQFLSNSNIDEGSPIEFKVSLIGEGNLSNIGRPKIKFPDEFDIFEGGMKEAYFFLK